MTGNADDREQEAVAFLIEECKKGNHRAQYRLYRQYSKAMYNLAFRMTNSREDAEDILQETFIECFRNLSSFRFESTFGGWLKRILINKSINHLRKKKLALVFPETLPEVMEDNYDEGETEYDVSAVHKCIELLPDGYRIVLTLYLLEGYDHSEIAQILGITESTSKSQYSRARAKLKDLLKNRMYG